MYNKNRPTTTYTYSQAHFDFRIQRLNYMGFNCNVAILITLNDFDDESTEKYP